MRAATNSAIYTFAFTAFGYARRWGNKDWSKFSNCRSAFLGIRLTSLILGWQCEDFCIHKAAAEIIACI